VAWCKLDSTFARDPKWKRLGKMLNVSRAQAAGHVACLYSWAAGNAPDGNVSDLDDDEIEDECLWEGPPGALIEALKSTAIGVLEKTRAGIVIHRFMERAENHKAAIRMKRYRERKNATVTPDTNVTDTNSDVTRDVTRDVTVTAEKRREEKEREEIAHGVVRFHRDLLKSKHGIEASEKISKNTIAHAKKIAALWPDDWRGVIEMYVNAYTEKRKNNRWPIGWLVTYSDDFDTQWRNRNVRVMPSQGDHLAKAEELQRNYESMEELTARKNREEDERLAKQGRLL
jgi:hypothetical protein